MSKQIPIFNYELEAQDFFYKFIGIEDKINKSYSTDGFLKSILFEHKLLFGSSYGLGKAKRQFDEYREKLRCNGEYDPAYSAAIEDNGNHWAIIYDNRNGDEIERFDWTQSPEKFLSYINDDVIKYRVNENTVIGLADKYYSVNKTANKRNFFDDYITQDNDKFYKFTGTEKDFRSIMDKLNDPMSQKVLGAFYTPDEYVKISTQYLRDAIKRVKDKGVKDYVIIDRCAGTGNLQKFLTEEELSHCILNTYEAKEWIALMQLYQGKVRRIIPPIYKPNGTLLEGGNALEEEFNNNFINEFELRDKGELGIIMLENPPYSAYTDMDSMRKKTVGIKGEVFDRETYKTFIYQQMSSMKIKNARSLVSQFIWSAFNIFKCDEYIVYAPIQYWKVNHIIDKQFLNGHICNRKYFHATESSISLIHWTNIDTINQTLLCNSDNGEIEIKKVYQSQSRLIDKDKEAPLANWGVDGFDIVDNNYGLSDNDKRAYRLTRNNLLKMLPLWCSNDSLMVYPNYPNKGILSRSSDGDKNYENDIDFMNDCLLFTLLTNKNKCSSKSELYTFGFSIFKQKAKHKKLLDLWQKIYNKTATYGLDNIIKDTNNYEEQIVKGKTILVWKDGDLRDWVETLKSELKKFYTNEIREKMLNYKLVV